ncbi:hypothetical protein [Niallia sp. 01092]|uniref:hypothetical protein n=1 Tax=unclassified Niallia TaxID=2837522 RepID=UPI003FD0AE19
MAKSQAKKKRDKYLKEYGFDTTIRRGSWGAIHPVTKKTKTKQEQLIKKQKKHRKNHSHHVQEDGFFVLALLNLPVDFRFRRSLSAGGPGASSALFPQESHAFHNNQHCAKINNKL